jgi:hypothetical protein
MKDGIIKYNFDFTPSEPLEDHLWKDIEQIRKRLYALKLIGINDEGIGYGNISQRVDKYSFVITGTQTGDLATLTNRHYSLIQKYNNEEFYLKSSGAIKPSSEALTHATIYNLSDDIKAVIHIHNKKLWDFMLENNYKKSDNVPYGSPQMIEEVKRIYNNSNPLENPKFVMAGHEEGIISFGRDLKEAEKILYSVLAHMIC